MRVEAVDRGRLRDVERFALRDAFGNVEQHDIAELLQPDEVSQRAADLTGADQSDLVARHGNLSFEPARGRRGKLGSGLSLSTDPFKSPMV